MTTATLSPKQHASSLVAGISRRPRHTRPVAGQSHPVLADIIPLTSAAPVLEYAPVTRTIGNTGRIRFTVGGSTLGDILGWTPGALSVELRGASVVLRPEERVDYARSSQVARDAKTSHGILNKVPVVTRTSSRASDD